MTSELFSMQINYFDNNQNPKFELSFYHLRLSESFKPRNNRGNNFRQYYYSQLVGNVCPMKIVASQKVLAQQMGLKDF